MMVQRTWLDKLETAGIVTVISVLVWLYAEGESVQTYTNERLQVRFVPPTGQDLAIQPREAEVLLSFRASAGEKDRFERLSQPVSVEVGVDPESDSPEQFIFFRDRLLETAVGEVGLNITGTTPDHRTLRVEPLVTTKLPVEVVAPNVQFSKPPTVEPREVNVTLRQSVADEAQGRSLLADLRSLDFDAFEVNTPHTVEVPLEAPGALEDDATRLGRETVQVSFTIRKLTDSVVLDRVPVLISTDPSSLQQYDIEVAQGDLFLRDVRLTGPSDAIAAINRGDVKVRAELRPSNEDLGRGVETLAPVLVAPDGVVADPLPPVPVTVTRR